MCRLQLKTAAKLVVKSILKSSQLHEHRMSFVKPHQASNIVTQLMNFSTQIYEKIEIGN